MKKEELISAQNVLGFNNTDMASALNIPYRTYYKWITGERDAPAVAETAVRLLLFVSENNLMKEWNETNK
ncbi:hypothetical protein [Pectobacterium brasiliense]|uniref:hypothetical protein n=1 Tax=Pectobacterium brasiliense TaxID=180957 RepID=UPI0032EFA74A